MFLALANLVESTSEGVKAYKPHFPSTPTSWSQASSLWDASGQQLVLVNISVEQALDWARAGTEIVCDIPDVDDVHTDMVTLPNDYGIMLDLIADRNAARGTEREYDARRRMFDKLRQIANRGQTRRVEFTSTYLEHVKQFERQWFGPPDGVNAMAVLTSDGFSGTDTNEINGRSGDAAGGGSSSTWQQAYGQLGILSNKCRGKADLGWYRDTAMAVTGDQRITTTHTQSGAITMTMARCQAAAISSYAGDSGYSGGGFRLWRWSGGGLTQIGGAWGSPANGDLVSVECIGSSIAVLKNGTSVGSSTDTNFADGTGGICHYFAGYDTDDYLSESIVAATGGTPQTGLETRMVQLRR